MQHEARSSSAVEFHLGRRGLLALDAALWLAATFDLFKYVLNRPVYPGDLWVSGCILFVIGWLALLLVHTARVAAAELRGVLAAPPMRAEAKETEVSMPDEELYEIARRRIDRRNRRWLLLGVDIFAFMLYVGAFVSLRDTIPHGLGTFIAVAWTGLIVLHFFWVSMAQNRDQAVEHEVAKLRDALYQKPKRLELTDDGEIIDFAESEADVIKHQHE